MKKKLLITGVSGFLGSNLAFCFKNQYEILGLYHSRSVNLKGIATKEVDLRLFSSTDAMIKEFKPEVVIHCAAQADVDACEVNRDQAFELNVGTTANLIKALKNAPTKLIQISTDLVYDGSKGMYTEEDQARPVNYYGMTKLASEQEALKDERSLILRTNFFGWPIRLPGEGTEPRRTLAQWAMAELGEGRPIKGFTDVHFSSIYTFDLAVLIAKIIEKNLKGVYNCASSTSLSKYEFIYQLAQKAGFDTQLIQPVSVDQFPFKAKRAKNLSLNVTKLSRDLQESLPSLEQSIEDFIRDFKNSAGL